MRENKEEIEDGKSLGYRQHKALDKYITQFRVQIQQKCSTYQGVATVY